MKPIQVRDGYRELAFTIRDGWCENRHGCEFNPLKPCFLEDGTRDLVNSVTLQQLGQVNGLNGERITYYRVGDWCGDTVRHVVSFSRGLESWWELVDTFAERRRLEVAS